MQKTENSQELKAISMKNQGLEHHEDWPEGLVPLTCPSFSMHSMITEAYQICKDPKIFKLKPGESSIDINQILCCPENCPLSETEIQKIFEGQKS